MLQGEAGLSVPFSLALGYECCFRNTQKVWSEIKVFEERKGNDTGRSGF